MKGAIWLLFGGVAVLAASSFARTGNALLKMGITLGGIKKVTLHLLSSVVYFDLNFANHTQKTLRLQQITGDIYLDGSYIGTIDERKEIVMKPGSTGTLQDIRFEVSNFTAFSTVLALINAQGAYKEWTMKGKVMGNGFLFPFEESGQFQVPKKPVKVEPKPKWVGSK